MSTKLNTFEQLKLTALRCASYTAAKILELTESINAVIEELDNSKADNVEASESAAGLMSASDKSKLNRMPSTVKVGGVLSGSGWVEQEDGTFVQTITVGGVTSDNDVLVAADNEYLKTYMSIGCRCVEQAENSLTFECDEQPTMDIPVSVIIYDFDGIAVIGRVDENNNIILNGALADGAYSIKYEMEDGSTVDIGNLVLDTDVYYSVTNNLTNCTNSNSANEVVEGESYSATIVANDGHELKSVSVTMGGTAVTVTNGVINIASVTGNLVITAVAEEKAVVNQIPLSTDANGNPYNGGQGWKTGYRISGSSGSESAQTGTEVTGFMPYTIDKTVYCKGIIDDGTHVVGFYDSSYAKVFTIALGNVGTFDGSVISPDLYTAIKNGLASGSDTIRFMRFSATTIDNNSIITINQPIE